ncbi:MULE domain-containing protein, partial [Aphis craccivora]
FLTKQSYLYGCRNTFGLTFLTPQGVSLCFIEDFISIMSSNNIVNQYAGYLSETYISQNATFPPPKKPNIFMWLNIIKQIHTNIYCKIRSIHTPNKLKDYLVNKRCEAIDNAIIKF